MSTSSSFTVRRPVAGAAIGLALAAAALLAGCASSPPAAQVRILEPADGATVATTFKVKFGLQGMTVAPAGDIVAGTGHHHLLINQSAMSAGEVVPVTPQHIHYGKGQTEAEVKLTPGTYKLTAQFANGAHQSYGSALAHTITVTVK